MSILYIYIYKYYIYIKYFRLIDYIIYSTVYPFSLRCHFRQNFRIKITDYFGLKSRVLVLIAFICTIFTT